jgi:quinol monooxygenase YgiN
MSTSTNERNRPAPARARDDSGIWISEVWDSEASHAASLTLPTVKEAITKGRPLIAAFGPRYVTPVGGHGLAAR